MKRLPIMKTKDQLLVFSRDLKVSNKTPINQRTKTKLCFKETLKARVLARLAPPISMLIPLVTIILPQIPLESVVPNQVLNPPHWRI